MASACVNNIGVSPEKFTPATYPSYGWLSPRVSFSREDDPKPASISAAKDENPEDGDTIDFEFRLDDDPIAMLPADELFSDGKLVPLQITNATASTAIKPSTLPASAEVRSPEIVKTRRSIESEIDSNNVGDSYLFSPKAPRCSSRWKELLGLKKLYLNANAKPEQNPKFDPNVKPESSSLTSTNNPKSFKRFLHRSSKSCGYGASNSVNLLFDQSLSLPLLKDSDCESVSISSSRLSLSSSSSSHEHESDLPRLSLDSDKLNPNLTLNGPNPFVINRTGNPPRMRLVKVTGENGGNSRAGGSPIRRSTEDTSRGVSVDSPRMNSSGKIVFQSLERSSSSPSSFNGGPRFKHGGVERSYSANVRVTPVLNVPVCSLRGSSKSGSVFGFGQLFSSSPQKRDSNFIHKAQQQQHCGNRRARD